MPDNIISAIRRRFKHKHKWAIIRTIWPYEDGWGTYCKSNKCGLLLDTGLSKREAKKRLALLQK